MAEEEVFNTHIWGSGYGGRGDPEPTRAECWGVCAEPGRVTHFYPCSRKGKVTRKVAKNGKVYEGKFCGTHDPVAVQERQKRRNAKFNAKYAEMQAKWAEADRIQHSRPAFVEALRKIAKGDNDPRTTAREALEQWGEPLE